MMKQTCAPLFLLILALLASQCSHKKKSHGRTNAAETTVEGADGDLGAGGTIVTREVDGQVIVLDKILSGDSKILDGIQKISSEPGDGSEFLKACQNPSELTQSMVDVLKAMVGEQDCLRAHDKLIYMREFWITKDLNISDISLLEKLTNVTLLHLSSNELTDISPLAKLVHLQILHLPANAIKDISPLSQLQELTSLNINGNLISDISPLAGLKKLNNLDLDFNKISDISPLMGLLSLQRLLLSDNQISSLESIAPLSQLQVLHVSSNPISDLVPLQNLLELKTLHIVSTQVASLAPVASLLRLSELDARVTPVAAARTAENCPLSALAPAVQMFCQSP